MQRCTEESKLSLFQQKLLEMMKWFHKFCIKNNLRYFAIGGTMLGAVRHKGFIPWDDDLDIGMPRGDYERMIALMKDTKHPVYAFETPSDAAEDFQYPYSKLYDTRTTLIEKKRTKVVRGVFLDIFPLDGIANREEDISRNYEPINHMYNYYLMQVGAVRKGRAFYKNLAVLLMRLVPRRFLDSHGLALRLNALCKRYDYDSSEWVGNLLGTYRIREMMPRAVIGDPVEYPFEDMMIFGVADYERYLTNLYGDWRKLPPPEKQISHHEFDSFNLDQPYK